MPSGMGDSFVWLIEIYSFWIADGPAMRSSHSIHGGTCSGERSDDKTGLVQ